MFPRWQRNFRGISAAILAALLLLQPASLSAADTDQQAVDAAIVRALDYLASQQQENGSWKTQAWGESTAITSLAVMAFLAAGHVPNEGPYGERINRGIRWVTDHQLPDGLLVDAARTHGPMYNHGISTLMLAEVVGMIDEADSAVVKRALEQAVLLILKSQAVDKFERHQGGWRYQPDSQDSDLSVTGWQVLALRAAKDIGCDVPAEAIDEAIRYVNRCSVNGKGFSYQPGGSATQTLTGVGITCLEVCGLHHSEETLNGARWLAEHPLDDTSHYFYYGVYYTGVGMFKVGGLPADVNHQRLVSLLLPLQKENGSWIPQHGSERGAGAVYTTSLAVLGLTVEYGYLPIYQR